jgi:hypothetical protein
VGAQLVHGTTVGEGMEMMLPVEAAQRGEAFRVHGHSYSTWLPLL